MRIFIPISIKSTTYGAKKEQKIIDKRLMF